MRVHTLIAGAGGLFLTAGLSTAAELNWSIFADQTALSSPTSEPRSLRAIAVNPQSTTLVASYINGTTSHSIKVYDAASGSGTYGAIAGSFSTSTGSHAAKAIAVDDRGYIFTGRSDDTAAQIRIFESDFDRINSADVPLTSFGHDKKVHGMDVVKSGSNYYLYTTSSSSTAGWVNRWNVTDPTSPIADTTFDTDGRFDLTTLTGGANATYLRGIDVAADGVIYTASLDNGFVHRISADLTTAISAPIARAHDVAVFGDRLYVVTYDGDDSRVHVLDAATLASIEVLDPVGAMGLTRGTTEGFSGIDIDANGLIYVSDQVYASTGSSISDRIFVAAVPEPASLALIALATGLLSSRVRRGVGDKVRG